MKITLSNSAYHQITPQDSTRLAHCTSGDKVQFGRGPLAKLYRVSNVSDQLELKRMGPAAVWNRLASPGKNQLSLALVAPERAAAPTMAASGLERMEKGDPAKPDGTLVGTGSRAMVYLSQAGDSIIKIPKDQMAPESILHEQQMFNLWAEKTGRPSEEKCHRVGEQALSMPYRQGTVPSQQEVSDTLRSLHQAGLLIADPKPQNFVKVGNAVLPVDFGLMFARGAAIDSPEIKQEIVSDYVKGGYRHIPDEIRADYQAQISAIGSHGAMGRMNIRSLQKAGFNLRLHLPLPD